MQARASLEPYLRYPLFLAGEVARDVLRGSDDDRSGNRTSLGVFTADGDGG